MKKLLMFSLLLAWAVPASATVYTDATGDEFFGGPGHIDIASVEVTNTATDITFAITLNGDILATDWGKYMVIIDSVAGGDTVGNGWGRPISMTSGADYWIGSWVDSGNGAELYDYTGAWNLQEATYNAPPNNDISISTSTNTATITTTMANLGLTPGDSFEFDVFTSGGGGTDGAVDSLGNPNQQVGDWGDQSNAFPQTYVTVPEPATMCLLAIGGVLALRRRS
ncbi:MAG TPA: PEP-CTERM sorting domain-containing protein [Phycisphaerae bacterium]|nr:PEP-CTERM sorting domain-containing protein [Phycisphaerae bacterium]